MSVNAQSPSGTTASSGGVSGETTSIKAQATDTVVEVTAQGAETDTAEKPVKYESYKKALAEKKSLQERFEKLQAEIEAKERKALEEQGQYKQLAEQYKGELEKTRQEQLAQKRMIEDSQKMSALLRAMPGELNEKYWGLVNLEKIAIDPETGRPDELSVQKYVKQLAESYPEIIQKPGAPKIPSEAPSAVGLKPNLSMSEIAREIAKLNR